MSPPIATQDFLRLLYKIVHNLIYFPSNVVLPKHNSVVPTPLLHQPFARTNAFVHLLFRQLYPYGTIYLKKPLLLIQFPHLNHWFILFFFILRLHILY